MLTRINGCGPCIIALLITSHFRLGNQSLGPKRIISAGCLSDSVITEYCYVNIILKLYNYSLCVGRCGGRIPVGARSSAPNQPCGPPTMDTGSVHRG